MLFFKFLSKMAMLVCKYVTERNEEIAQFQNNPQTIVRPAIQDVFMRTIHTDEVY